MESESVNKKVSAISPRLLSSHLVIPQKAFFVRVNKTYRKQRRGEKKQKAQFAITHQFDMCVKKGHPKGEESTLEMKLSLDESK